MPIIRAHARLPAPRFYSMLGAPHHLLSLAFLLALFCRAYWSESQQDLVACAQSMQSRMNIVMAPSVPSGISCISCIKPFSWPATNQDEHSHFGWDNGPRHTAIEFLLTVVTCIRSALHAFICKSLQFRGYRVHWDMLISFHWLSSEYPVNLCSSRSLSILATFLTDALGELRR